MADQKISQLTSITGANTADDDVLVIVDTSASQTKKITLGELENALAERDFSFGDNDKLTFGNSSDLQIYHDGSNSYITDASTGDLIIDSNGNAIRLKGTNGENMIVADTDASAKLFHNGSEKLATTSTGIDVTGTVTADGLTVDANTGGLIKLTNTDTTLVDNQVVGRIEFEGADGSGAGAGTKGSITLASADAQGFSYDMNFGVSDTSDNDVTRLTIGTTGDISFYEDTGTTAKFFWDASAEGVSIGAASVPSGVSLNLTRSDTSAPFITYNSGQSAEITSFGAQAGLQLIGYQSAGGSPYTKTSAIIANSDGTVPSEMQFWTKTNGQSSPAERMRIDSSGNLLVGTTDNVPGNGDTNTGVAIGGTGYIAASAGGTNALNVNRNTSDGDIAVFRKDGSTVGSIGNAGANVYIGSDDVGLLFGGTFATPAIGPRDITGASDNDAAINLGWSSNRFKDLYLSGGVSNPSGALTFDTNGSEAMRIDASGNLLVGTTDEGIYNSSSAAGISLRGSIGLLGASRNSNESGNFNRYGTDGDIVKFRKDGSTVGSIGVNSGNNLFISSAASDHAGLEFSFNCVIPQRAATTADNIVDLGASSIRFDDVYATNGTIQTSDRNEKQDIEALSDAEQRVAVAAKGLLRKFRWIDSVAEKGDDARIHFGIIAQDLQDAFTAEGLDAGRYAMFFSSTWTDEETGEERTRMGVRYPELLAFIIAAI